MTLAEIAAELTGAASYSELQTAITNLNNASGQRAKNDALAVAAKKVCVCREELGIDPGLFKSAEDL